MQCHADRGRSKLICNSASVKVFYQKFTSRYSFISNMVIVYTSLINLWEFEDRRNVQNQDSPSLFVPQKLLVSIRIQLMTFHVLSIIRIFLYIMMSCSWNLIHVILIFFEVPEVDVELILSLPKHTQMLRIAATRLNDDPPEWSYPRIGSQWWSWCFKSWPWYSYSRFKK